MTALLDPESTAVPGPPAEERSSFHAERLSFALIVVAFLAMTALSWLKWADPLIDFGREIYLPWRLFEGDALYRNLAHPYAPLSPYVNLAWFSIFGVSYRSLVVGNMVLLSALLLLFYRLLRKIASVAATTGAILLIVLVFAFGQYIPIGNYNFLSPYAHELTHGLVLSMVAMSALARYFESQSRSALIAFGFVLGLVFLTKYEVFLAAVGAGAVGLASFWRANRRRLPWRHLLGLLAVLPVPFLICVVLLVATRLPWTAAFRAALGAYPFLLNPRLTANPFFSLSGGLDGPQIAIFAVVEWSAFYALSVLPAAFLGRGEVQLDHRIYGLAAFLLPFLALSLMGRLLPWGEALVLLPLFLVTSALANLRCASPPGSRGVSMHCLRLALTVFALLLLLKTPLNTRAYHYGFALALPGTALMIVALLDTTPAWLNSRGFGGRFFRIGAFGLLVAFAGIHVARSARFLAERIYSLGEGADSLRVDQRGAVIAKAVQVVRDRVGREETLVVLPEGAIVNYLTRRNSSISFVDFHPAAIVMYGERTMLDELVAHPPAYILSFSRDMRDLREMGCAVFGESCAQEIGAWVKEGYAPRVVAKSRGRHLFSLLAPIRRSSTAPGPEVIEVPLSR